MKVSPRLRSFVRYSNLFIAVALILFLGFLHWRILHKDFSALSVSLFFIPVALVSTYNGMKLGLAVSLLSVILTLPHTLFFHTPIETINEAGIMGLLVVSAIVIGKIADSHKKTLFLIKDSQANRELYITNIIRAQEEERKRIARDLHDDTIQSLIAISRNLDSMITKLSKSNSAPNGIQNHLEETWQLTEQTIKGVRVFSQDLRPSVLDDLGLVPAVEWLADRMGKHPVIKTQCQAYGKIKRLPPDRELALFRIVQEALNNIGKHSEASLVVINITFQSDKLVISLRDNGKGFNPPLTLSEASKKGQLGIMGMKERSQLFQGKLEIYSQPGQGCTVIIEMPLQESLVA